MAAPDGRPESAQPAWRGDFPVYWPQDQYVARRDFTKFLLLTSLAFVVGQFWIGVQNWFRRRRGLPEHKQVARLGDLEPGKAVTFRYPEKTDPCILVRLPDGPDGRAGLLAYDQKCTHLSCGVVPHLEDRPEDCRLLCPCHHGSFDLVNGRPLAGPPRRPLPRIKLEVKKDGTVWATGVEERTV
jgi:Rieske Fe-S protein